MMYLLSVADASDREVFSGCRDEIRHLFLANLKYGPDIDSPEIRLDKFGEIADSVLNEQQPFTRDVLGSLMHAAECEQVCFS